MAPAHPERAGNVHQDKLTRAGAGDPHETAPEPLFIYEGLYI